MPRFDRVSYSNSYETINQYGLKQWQKIGVELVLEPTDDPKTVLNEAKRLVDEFHKDTNKEFYTQVTGEIPVIQVNDYK